MSDFFRYFWIGFKDIWQYSIIRNAMIFFSIAFFIIIFRRISIALRSGEVFLDLIIFQVKIFIYTMLSVFLIELYL